MEIKLTQYSHGAGCGCKIAPSVLEDILGFSSPQSGSFPALLVGKEHRDDAAVYDLGDGTAIISTTDFFMPIVDDPTTFGQIAAANAISDVYAMGGTPLMAIAILGWPVNMLAPTIAGAVISGAQAICSQAGIPIAGGHSIDSPEPIFGLAVTGRVDISNLKKNGGAKAGDIIYLTKPLGTGVLSTAQKMDRISTADFTRMVDVMVRLNSAGERLAKIEGVHAMTDVTGFGLAGHLLEMCKASETSVFLNFLDIPIIDADLLQYARMGCVPAATNRNAESFKAETDIPHEFHRQIAFDPQTSGGLLLSVSPDAAEEVEAILTTEALYARSIGTMGPQASTRLTIR